MRKSVIMMLAVVFLLGGIAFAQDADVKAAPESEEAIQQVESQPAQEAAATAGKAEGYVAPEEEGAVKDIEPASETDPAEQSKE